VPEDGLVTDYSQALLLPVDNVNKVSAMKESGIFIINNIIILFYITFLPLLFL